MAEDKKEPLVLLSVRVDPETYKRLPRASLKGRRAAFIRDAIKEKLDREDKAHG